MNKIKAILMLLTVFSLQLKSAEMAKDSSQSSYHFTILEEANKLYENDNDKEAAELYMRIINDPKSSPEDKIKSKLRVGRMKLGGLGMEANPDEGRRILEDIINGEYDLRYKVVAYADLGQYCMSIDNYEEASKFFQLALSTFKEANLKESDLDALFAKSYAQVKLGSILVEKEKYSEASELLESYINTEIPESYPFFKDFEFGKLMAFTQLAIVYLGIFIKNNLDIPENDEKILEFINKVNKFINEAMELGNKIANDPMTRPENLEAVESLHQAIAPLLEIIIQSQNENDEGTTALE